MARTAQFARLAQRLRDASAGRDWRALAVVDDELAALLAQLPAGTPLTLPERAALADLQAAHRQARAQCASVTNQLSDRMAAMQANRDGWLAYALNSDLSENPEQ